jgi:hypothetical protein
VPRAEERQAAVIDAGRTTGGFTDTEKAFDESCGRRREQVSDRAQCAVRLNGCVAEVMLNIYFDVT